MRTSNRARNLFTAIPLRLDPVTINDLGNDRSTLEATLICVLAVISARSSKSYSYAGTEAYLANSASCLGSERSRPGIPPGGSFLPVIYSV